MSDYKLKLDKINEEYAKAVAALERETKILKIFADAGLPVPDYIECELYGSIGVTYRNDYEAPRSMADAVEMLLIIARETRA